MSKLNSTSLTLNNKEISGVETTLTADNTKIPTSKALYDYLKDKGIKPFAPTSLSVSGSWAKQQNRTRVNLTGLTFTATYADGTRGTVNSNDVNVSPITWNVKTSEAQRVTFTYTVKGTTQSTESTVGVGIDLERLEVSGDWSNVQFYGTTPDLAGLTFTAYYNDDSSGQVPPGQISVSPSTWSGLGTQTATFSYTDGDVTKATTKDATVVRKLTGLTVGPWIKTQYTGQAVDYTGMTFTASYNNNTTATVTPSDYDPKTWSSTAGTQTCTFYYSENGITKSATKSASVADYWSTVPLTLQAREAGDISITKDGDPGTIYYSKNGGSQTALDSGVNISVSPGDKVSFYRTLSSSLSDSKSFTIKCTNNCYVYGNVMSLYNKDNFANLTTIGYDYAFYKLFNKNNYININESVGKLLLPATTLTSHCYGYMFRGCTSLTTAPELPATTLAIYCYSNMFWDCTSLTTAPALPATTLAESCYASMFENCTSLTTAPALPATTLANYCYSGMFYKCTNLITAPATLPATILAQYCYRGMFDSCKSLTTAPRILATTTAYFCCYQMFYRCTSLTTVPSNMLPATTLAEGCYNSMFEGCTNLTTAPTTLPATTLASRCYANMFNSCKSLTTAPTLPATTLAEYCYASMFISCANLTSITCLATSISAFNCTSNWVNGVASSGTFYKNSAMSSWTTGNNGTPSGWTVRNA